MTRAMNTLILTRAHYRRRYGNDAPEMSIPSRFLEEVPNQLVESLGGRPQATAWSTPGYPNTYGSRFAASRKPAHSSEFADQHYNYEDESQEAQSLTGATKASGSKSSPSKPFVASWMTAKPKPAPSNEGATPKGGSPEGDSGAKPNSIDNIARFFGGNTAHVKPEAFSRPTMDLPEPTGAANLKKGQRVRHSKYGEGTILMREGSGEDAKLTVMFIRHGMKKLMEKFANLQRM
jgi:DNA helicase-2/ATP-dependent DNA helicase PcrA